MIEPIRYRRDLWKLIQALGIKGDAAEIGVAEGSFSADILSWPVNFPRLYMVDRWTCLPNAAGDMVGDGAFDQAWHDKNRLEAIERVKPYGVRAVLCMGESVEIAKRIPDDSLSFVNVDGDHSYEGVRADNQAWHKKMKSNGVIAFHDYENPAYGVKQAVQEFAQSMGLEVFLIPEDREEDAGAYLVIK